MRRAAMFTVVWAALAMAFAGVALAAVITCTGGRCDGTNNPDQITGSPLRDRIFALAGADQVQARAGDDELNGGPNRDFIEGNEGDDILRGQEGSEHLGTTQPTMFGDQGDDKLFGGPGEDGLQGDEGTDEHYGGDNNDYINAAGQETSETDAPDLVDCGRGIDTVVRRPADIVLTNCEELINVADDTTVAPSLVT